jgi:hypothetical protein
MLSSPIIIFYSILILIFFVIGVAPTALWERFGVSVSRAGARTRRDRVAARFAKATAVSAFTAEIDYVPVGIGFAFDRGRALLFVAGDRFGTPAEALVPVADVRAHDIGVITGGFTDENYVDLFPTDATASNWRISCAGDVDSADAIGRLLSSLGIPKA